VLVNTATVRTQAG